MLFEATPVSIGRGTDFAFQVIGYSPVALGDFSFTPRSIKGAALNPKFKDQMVKGIDLRHSNITGLNLNYLINVYQQLTQAKQVFLNVPILWINSQELISSDLP